MKGCKSGYKSGHCGGSGMIKVGQRVKYNPFNSMSYLGVCEIRQIVTGVVIYINYKRGWFTVENEGIKTTFRFTEKVFSKMLISFRESP